MICVTSVDTIRTPVVFLKMSSTILSFISSIRRLHNLDVEVAASGFTRDMSESFDEVYIKS